MDEFLHVGLMTRGSEDVLLEGSLFVELEDEDEQGSWDVIVAATHLVQGHSELHSGREGR